MNTQKFDISCLHLTCIFSIKYLKYSSELRQLLLLLFLSNKLWYTFMVLQLRLTLRVQDEVC